MVSEASERIKVCESRTSSRNGSLHSEAVENGEAELHAEIPLLGTQEITKTDGKKRNRHQWLVLIILGFGNFCVAASFSLQGPFYPKEAEMKGLTPTQYGIVFSIFQLTMFVFAPICGKVLSVIGPKFMLTSGLFIVGCACILFGFLTRGPDGLAFLGLSVTTRAVEGFGTAAFETATFAIIAAEFPLAVATTYAIIQTCYGMGLIVGPTIGGALYQAGGFLLPFAAIGAVLLLCDAVIVIFLPGSSRSTNTDGKTTGQLLKFWANMSVVLDAYCIFSTFLCVGFNITFLEPHIREFNLTPVVVGFLFVISGSVFAASAPFWGRLTDKTDKIKALSVVGCLFIVGYLLLFGPAPFIPLEKKLGTIITSLTLLGFGISGSTVSPFLGVLRDTVKRGFPDDMTTYGLVSSLFTSSNSMGAFVGPTLSGWLVENIGLKATTMVLLGNEIFVICLLLFYSALKKNTMWQEEEKEPLLQKSKVSPGH